MDGLRFAIYDLRFYVLCSLFPSQRRRRCISVGMMPTHVSSRRDRDVSSVDSNEE